MMKLINSRVFLFCVIALMIVGLAFAQEKKEEPKKVDVDLLLKSGKEVKLTDVDGDEFLTLFWGSFELKVEYYDIQKCEFSGEPAVENNKYTIDAKVLLSNGTELAGRAMFYESYSIEGKWEFGTRKVFWKDVLSINFRRTAGPPESVLKPLGTITDQKGKTILMLSLPETKGAQSTKYVHDEIFGNNQTIYFALPYGGGYIFLPFSDIAQVLGKEAGWEVETGAGEKLSLVVSKEGPVQALAGKCNLGRFKLKPDQLKTLKLEPLVPPTEKPKSGLASQSLSPISGTLTDHSGLTYKLEGIQFYYLVYYYGMWIGRRPSDYSTSLENILVKLPDQSEATIELANLKSIFFREGELQSITSMTGNMIEAKLYDRSGSGRNHKDEGFVGLVTVGQKDNKYWGYFPIVSIKTIQFE